MIRQSFRVQTLHRHNTHVLFGNIQILFSLIKRVSFSIYEWKNDHMQIRQANLPIFRGTFPQ